MRVGNGDSPNGFFMLATSDDGGAKWSKPRVVIDPTDPPNAPQRRALVGNLWTDPLGPYLKIVPVLIATLFTLAIMDDR